MAHNDKMMQLFSFMDGNEGYLNDLIDRIKSNVVVPFIGAGMSAPIYPTWAKFISDTLGNKRISHAKKDKIKRLLGEYKYEKAASTICESLGKADYAERIKSAFREEKIYESELTNMAVSLVPLIFKTGTVITTNFDRLLHKVYAQYGCPFTDYLTPYEVSDDAKGDFHQGIAHYLLKLHGDYLHTDRIVFTKEQYDKCYGKNYDSEYVSFITDALSSKVLLFLGCSLDTDRTMSLMQKTALDKSRTHYAVVECGCDDSDHLDAAFYEKNKRLSDMGIRCIWYPKGRYEFVYSILEGINARLPQSAPLTAPSEREPRRGPIREQSSPPPDSPPIPPFDRCEP